MTYTVTPYDHPLRWLVSRPQTHAEIGEWGTPRTHPSNAKIGYIVEWSEDGRWDCSCTHGQTHPGRARCRHVVLVTAHVLEQLKSLKK